MQHFIPKDAVPWKLMVIASIAYVCSQSAIAQSGSLDEGPKLLIQSMQELAEARDSAALQTAISLLQHENINVQIAAANALSQLNDRRAVEPLIKKLKERKYNKSYRAQGWQVTMTITRALATLGDERAIQPMIDVLRDERSGVQGWVEKDLARMKSDHAITGLIVALGDDAPHVRNAAADQLGELKEKRAVEPLLKLLSDPQSQAVAAYALQRIAAPAVPGLIKALQENDSRWVAAATLAKIGQPAIDLLMVSLQSSDARVRQCIAWALGMTKDTMSNKPLVAALHDQDVYTRAMAAWALGELRTTSTIGPLVDALYDDQPNVRKNAAGSLARIGAPAIDTLVSLLHTAPAAQSRWIKLALWCTGNTNAYVTLARPDARQAEDTCTFDLLVNGDECLLFRMDRSGAAYIDSIVLPPFLEIGETNRDKNDNNNTKAGVIDDVVYNHHGWIACLSRDGKHIDLARYHNSVFDYLPQIQLPAGCVARCLALKDNRLFIGGNNNYIGFCDLSELNVVVQTVDMRQNKNLYNNNNAVDALFIEDDKVIAVDDIVTPKYFINVDSVGSENPFVDTIIKMPSHGVYESIWTASMNDKWIATLSSTSGRNNFIQHISIYDKKTLREVGYLSLIKKATRLVGYPELDEPELSYWQSLAFCGKWLVVAYQHNGLELYDFSRVTFEVKESIDDQLYRIWYGSNRPAVHCGKKRKKLHGSALTLINYPAIGRIGVVMDVDGRLETAVFNSKDF